MTIDGIRTRNIFDPDGLDSYRLSRSKIELFLQCPRCFYLDRRMGIARPEGPAFTLNLAVDSLMKGEFDIYRAEGKPHPVMEENGIEAIPFSHPDMEEWRDPWKGITVHDKKSGFTVHGAIDDVWVDAQKHVIIVDYKATSSAVAPSLDGPMRMSYKRQAEVYQWLFRRNGFPVNNTAYFVFANADKSRGRFDSALQFSLTVVPYEGSDLWIPDALLEARACLLRELPPPQVSTCEWCAYAKNAGPRDSQKLASAL